MKLPDLAAKQADLNPNRVAFIDPDRDWHLTYAMLDERASRLAETLTTHWGVTAGTRIATLAHNRIEAVELLFACAKIGAVFVPLNWRLSPSELDYILRDADVRGIVHDDAHATTAGALAARVPGDSGAPRLLNFDDPTPGGYEGLLAAASGKRISHDPREEDELWYLIYTSGTTGRPKGVHQTAGMALVNYLNIGIATSLAAGDTFLSVLPQFHTGGWNLYLLPIFFVGGTTILPRTFDPDQCLDLLAGEANVFFGVPANYQALAEHPVFARADLSGVRSWAAGGAALPVPLLRRLDARGVQVRQGMGMTETGPTVFLLDADNAIRKAGSVGKPQGFVDVRIVDLAGVNVQQGERGEMLIRGPGVTPGYWRAPERTAEAFAEGGWLRTGDIAMQDEEGFYYIVDRAKDMYISGAENVYPAEVEAVIIDIEGVRACAVIGVHDDRWGEVGKAIIELTPGAELTADQVREHCRAHLARYKTPAHVTFTAELPRNATGKILKHKLVADPGQGERQ